MAHRTSCRDKGSKTDLFKIVESAIIAFEKLIEAAWSGKLPLKSANSFGKIMRDSFSSSPTPRYHCESYRSASDSQSRQICAGINFLASNGYWSVRSALQYVRTALTITKTLIKHCHLLLDRPIVAEKPRGLVCDQSIMTYVMYHAPWL